MMMYRLADKIENMVYRTVHKIEIMMYRETEVKLPYKVKRKKVNTEK